MAQKIRHVYLKKIYRDILLLFFLIFFICSVKIDLVFLDDTNKPVDALDSIKILENEVIQEELAKNGATVTSVAAQESEPRPINTESSMTLRDMMSTSHISLIKDSCFQTNYYYEDILFIYNFTIVNSLSHKPLPQVPNPTRACKAHYPAH